MKKFILAVFSSLILLSACNLPHELLYNRVSGFALGTSYHITYGALDSVDFSNDIDSILKDFELSLSTYQPASLISMINRNETDSVDMKFKKNFEIAKEVYEASDGAFDITVLPLVNAWGFGPGTKQDIDSMLIDSLLQFVGMDKIRIEDNRVIKDNPGVTLDLNAIAKGYSVDVVADFLEKRKVNNYMIEIGGELRTKGLNPNHEVWKIGLDKPFFGNMMPGQNLQAVILLDEKSLATSGNYRRFYEEDGVKYTHSIDPKTGYPARSSLLSATIISDECIVADAYATACMVMGLEKAKALLANHPELEAYLIFGDEEGEFQIYLTGGMEKLIKEQENP